MSEVTFDFHGKNFAVVGASSGVGKQVTLELLQAGANVLAISRRKELMDEIYADYPDQIMTAEFDVKNFDDWDTVLNSFVSTKGKFDGSVYTAGIDMLYSFRALDVYDARAMMDTNFFGAIFFLKKFIRAIYSNSGTSNVWIASAAAHTGEKSMAAYAATKGALISAVNGIALEIGVKNHRLNTISPGWLKTPMTKEVERLFSLDGYILKRPGTPEDISGMILFLLSERSSWITGTDIIIDGGYLAN